MTLPTRALSLMQPWAYAVTNLGKTIENRTWFTDYRGEFWIHASMNVTGRYYREACEKILEVSGKTVPHQKALKYGGIVGRARIVDCILPGGFKSFATGLGDTSKMRDARKLYLAGRPPFDELHPLSPHPWHFPDQYGYVLEDVKAVPFVPCLGRQQWWDVPAEVLARLVA